MAGRLCKMRPLCLFICCVQKELATERFALRDYLQGDILMLRFFNVFLRNVPANPLIAEPVCLAKYIERMGTGIFDLVRRYREAGLPEPEIKIDNGVWTTTIWRKHAVGDQISWEGAQSKQQIIRALANEPCSANTLSVTLGLNTKTGFFKRLLQTLIDGGVIKYRLPEKLNSRLQKYHLTNKGRTLLKDEI